MDLYLDCGVELLNVREAGIRGRFSDEYRRTLIGRTSPTKGKKAKEITKQRRSISMKGVKKTDQHKENIRLGKLKLSESAKMNMSLAQKKRYENASHHSKIDRNLLKNAIIEYQENKITLPSLANKYNVSINTIRRAAKEAGCSNRRPKK